MLQCYTEQGKISILLLGIVFEKVKALTMKLRI